MSEIAAELESRLPRWDMTNVFPSLESPEYDAAVAEVETLISALAEMCDSYGVRRRTSADVDDAFVVAYETITGQINHLTARSRVVSAYTSCFTTTDAGNDAARSRQSILNVLYLRMEKLTMRYTAWVGTTDTAELLRRSSVAREHEYNVLRAGYQAAHQMPEAEEELATELRPSATSGWARLHGNLTALLSVTVPLETGPQQLPMSAVRALSNNTDRSMRQAAYDAEIAAWKANALPLAAALNAIKSFQQVLRRRRGFADDVEPTLFGNAIDSAALAAMQQACVESFPDFRRYMKAKARALGIEALQWYDISAPVGAESRAWSWPEAETFIARNFGKYSARMREFAERTFRDRWIDAEPRVGKEGGAYCTGLRPGESRVMMNYNGSFGSVSTLAHELGHAYHNLNLQDRTPMQRGTPSTLAETASIFCETIAFEAAQADAAPAERITLLDTVLERNLMVVVDIHSRFLFEKSVFEKRTERELTVTEFNDLMTAAQRATYGDGLASLHPYMWAVKGHYYGPTFYNYPYTFGLLFGLGLYALYLRDPEGFRGQYDDLLSATGMADAVTLASRFGINIQSVDFWRSSLDVIRGQIAEFERLVE